MAHSGPEADAVLPGDQGLHPRQVARFSRRLGVALLGAALPALVATALVAAPEMSDGVVRWTTTAMHTSVVAGGGLQWAFHVAAVVGLAGVWAFGFASLVEGYFGVD